MNDWFEIENSVISYIFLNLIPIIIKLYQENVLFNVYTFFLVLNGSKQTKSMELIQNKIFIYIVNNY